MNVIVFDLNYKDVMDRESQSGTIIKNTLFTLLRSQTRKKTKCCNLVNSYLMFSVYVFISQTQNHLI